MSTIIPHHISCSLLIKTVVEQQKDGDVWEEDVSLEQQRKLLIMALKLVRNTDITWTEFQQSIKSVLDKDQFSLFVKSLHKAKNLDQLMDLFQTFESLFDIRKNLLKHHSSVLGLFIRKLLLDYKQLSFEKVNSLTFSMQLYLNSTANDVEGKNTVSFDFEQQPTVNNESSIMEENNLDLSSMDETNIDLNTMEESFSEEDKENIVSPTQISPLNSSASHKKGFVSRNRAVRFLTEQAKLLETNDLSALAPCKMQLQIDEIQQNYPDLYEIYYLSFLNYLRLREVHRATVMLQKFFDHKVFTDEKNDGELSALEKHQLKFKRFRYCALNLGIMHCCYGNHSEALVSLEEAIRIAQETNDSKCLSHAMFWLSVVKEESSSAVDGEDYLKQFIAETAKDILKSEGHSGTQHIDYLGVLRLIKIQCFKGTQGPSKLLSTVSQLIVSNPDIANTGQLVRSTMFAFYGIQKMTGIMCQIPLQHMVMNNRRILNPLSLSEENMTVSLCHLADSFVLEGFYEEALLILSFTSDKSSLYNPQRKTIQLLKLQINFKLYLHKRAINCAIPLANSIATLDKHEGNYAKAIVDVLLGNTQQALTILKDLLLTFDSSDYSEISKPAFKVKLLLLQIDILLMSSNPSHTVNKIFELIDYTAKKYMLGANMDAKIALVNYLLKCGYIEKADQVVEELMLQGLINGSCYQRGMLSYLKAKCCIRMLPKNLTSDQQKSELLQTLSLLDKSLCCFQKGQFKTHLRNVYLEQAMIFHQLGYFQERNKAATQYRVLHEQIKDFPSITIF